MIVEPFSQLRLGIRRLLRTPGYALTCIVTLSLGMGATIATFSIVQAVLLEPLPFDDAEELVSLRHRAPGITTGPVTLSQPMYFTYLDSNRSFSEIGLFNPTQAVITGLDEPEQVGAFEVTESLLTLLRVRPRLGRLFNAEDDRPGAAPTVLLTHDYWQRRLGADPSVTNETLRIDGRPHQVIGVLPAEFELPNFKPDIYLAAKLDPANPNVNDYNRFGLARLRPGVTIAAANADIDRMLPMSAERFGGMSIEVLEDMQWGADLRSLTDDFTGDVKEVLWILLGTAGLVLLIGCSNVANLFLVRTESRQQEVALRSALGAGRLGIAQLFLSESVGMALVSGAAGIGLAMAGLRGLAGSGIPFVPRLQNVGLNGTVLLFAFAVTLASGLLVGLIPVFRLRKSDLLSSLKEGGRGAIGDQRHRSRRLLVVVQIAMTFVLLVGSGLMIRSFRSLQNVHPGFETPTELLTLAVAIPEAEIPSAEQAALALERIQQGLEQLPGVASVGAADGLPMGGAFGGEVFWQEGENIDFSVVPPIRRVKAITPGYLGTMQTSLLLGRDITWADIHDRTPVVLVTENLARELWTNPAEAIGRRIGMGHPTAGLNWREVVGVTTDVREDGPSQEAPTGVYWPMAAMHVNRAFEGLAVPRSMTFVMRADRRDPASLVAEARRAIREVNPNLPIAEVATMQDIVDRALAPTTLTLAMLLISAAVALLLGMVGVYAIMSYIVVQRRQEIAVRMAFGAAARDILRMVGTQGLTLAGIGLVTGLVAAFAATRVMSSLLFGVTPADPLTFAAVAMLLSAMVLVACLIPARRASQTNPIEALHGD